MSIFKDWAEWNDGYDIRRKVRNIFNMNDWRQLHKWRKQRADRGWSDRDTWGAGDHIAKMTAEMLQHLQNNVYKDWPEWFKFNVAEEGRGAYTNLQEVIDDINNYLEFDIKSWADGLTPKQKEISDKGKFTCNWYDESTGKKLTEAAVSNRINRYSKENMRLYKKANKAMGFFGRHFGNFWD